MNAEMASAPQKRRVAVSYLLMLAGSTVAFPWFFAGCIDTTPPWDNVTPMGGSGGSSATGGVTGQTRDGPASPDGALVAGSGGAIGSGGTGTAPATGGAGGALDGPGTGGSDETDGGPGGAGDIDAWMLDVPQVGTGGAGVSDGGYDLATGGTGGAFGRDASVAAGGTLGTGGATATGGTLATGGTAANGGTSGTGGTPGTGGTNPSGGTNASGGSSTTGGTNASGGTSTTGGNSATGGSSTTGGQTGLAGATGAGGAAGSTGTTGAGGTVRFDADIPQDAGPLLTGLLVYYDFEGSDGAMLPDQSGKGNHGTLSIGQLSDGGVPKDPGYQLVTGKTGLGKALSLHRAGLGFVRVPPAVFAGATDLTVAMWTSITTSQSWQRLFDVGIDAHLSQNAATGTKYLNLVPNGSDSTASNMLFRITGDGYNNEQKLTAGSPSVSTWAHVALVLTPGGGGKLYVNGEEKDSQSGVTLRPTDLGAIDYAFIGKSPFTADSTFDGIVDEFRVYGRALSADEVRALYNYAGP
jgi:hypothetical protein